MIRVLALALLLPAAAIAQAGQTGSSALKGHDTDAPVNIDADHSELLDRQNRVVFTGKVHAVQGEMTMDTARMTVAYTKSPTPGEDPQIQRIDAAGGVTVVSPTERAKGSFGIYDLNRKLITLIGGVTLTRGDNVVNGARLVIDLNTGRSTVDGNTVAGGGAGAAGTSRSGGRVTGRFTVPKRNQTPSQTTPSQPSPPAGK